MADENAEVIRQKMEELRKMGDEFAALTGREPRFARKRISMDDKKDNNGRPRRSVFEAVMEDRVKRPRLIYDDPAPRRRESKDLPPIRRPTIASSVRMPTIETKSRDQIIAEQKKNQKSEDGKRNQRMFGNLLMGTLRQFQQEEKTPAKVQAEKLREVEEKLEKAQQEEKEKFMQDKKAMEMKMKEKEVEIKRLKDKRAVQIKSEIKVAHYKRLQNFIQTEKKPAIFYIPARHTIRTMELLKNSARKLDELIKERLTETENTLREMDELSDGEIAPVVRSAVKMVGGSKETTDSRAHLRPLGNTESENIDDGIEDDEDSEEGEEESVETKPLETPEDTLET